MAKHIGTILGLCWISSGWNPDGSCNRVKAAFGVIDGLLVYFWSWTENLELSDQRYCLIHDQRGNPKKYEGIKEAIEFLQDKNCPRNPEIIIYFREG